MAELLIQAKPHHLDSASQSQIDAMPGYDKDSFNARARQGCIICVYEDGRCTEPPCKNSAYIIVRLIGVNLSDVKYLVSPLYKDEERTITVEVPKTYIDNVFSRDILMADMRFKAIPIVMAATDNQYTISGVATKAILKHKHAYRVPESWIKEKTENNEGLIDIKDPEEISKFLAGIIKDP
jgi:hypothetical protein